MRWTLLLAAACATRLPADPLPEVPPPLPADEYATVELGEASPFVRAAIANLQLGATADGVAVAADERLSRVAARLAHDQARLGRLPPSAAIQDLAADAGAPYVVGTVAVEVLPRRRRIATDLYAAYGRAVPGGSLPLAVGAGAWEDGGRTVLVLVLTRRAFWLSAPVPREGAAVVPLIGATDTPSYGLLAVDGGGVHLEVVPAGSERTASVPVPVEDGWVELLAIDGERSETLGLLRLGAPAEPPGPEPGLPPADAVGSGVRVLRDAWGLPAVEILAGDGGCDEVPDVVGGVEVTRDQRCVDLFAPGDAWGALARRPLALRAVAAPEAELVAVGVDGSRVTVRALQRFRRMTSDEATEALAAAVEARWPGIRRVAASPFPDLAIGWAETGDPIDEDGEIGARADDVAARWVGSGRWMRVLSASQHLERLLDPASGVTGPKEYAVGVALGEGPDGEPLYYAAVGFRM